MKEQRDLLHELERNGVDVRQAKRGHFKVYDAAGRLVATIAKTSTSRRGMLNARAECRRAGLI